MALRRANSSETIRFFSFSSRMSPTHATKQVCTTPLSNDLAHVSSARWYCCCWIASMRRCCANSASFRTSSTMPRQPAKHTLKLEDSWNVHIFASALIAACELRSFSAPFSRHSCKCQVQPAKQHLM